MIPPSPIWHPFTQHGLREDIPLIETAKGALLYPKDCPPLIDAISSWWVTTHGHGNPQIMAAIAEQAGRLDQIIFAGFTHEPAEQLARGLTAMMPPSLTRVFFSDSGSTSVEVALKMALGYWKNRGEPRHRIIVMEHSYHGDTIGTMSVGERGVFNRAYEELLFDVATLPFPERGEEQNTLDTLEHICRNERPAAFIVEPLILGAGGMLVYPPHVLAEMHAICARHDVLFIADEVMTGWGRTGALLACEQADIVPDILCLSKGLTGGSLPLAVTIAAEPLFEAHWSDDRAQMFFHSSSYTANPIACAAANANLAIWHDEPVLARIATLAGHQAQFCQQLASNPKLGNARQIGTIVACDLAVDDPGYTATIGRELAHAARAAEVLLRPLGNTVYVMPPYCISEVELARVYAAITDFTG